MYKLGLYQFASKGEIRKTRFDFGSDYLQIKRKPL